MPFSRRVSHIVEHSSYRRKDRANESFMEFADEGSKYDKYRGCPRTPSSNMSRRFVLGEICQEQLHHNDIS